MQTHQKGSSSSAGNEALSRLWSQTIWDRCYSLLGDLLSWKEWLGKKIGPRVKIVVLQKTQKKYWTLEGGGGRKYTWGVRDGKDYGVVGAPPSPTNPIHQQYSGALCCTLHYINQQRHNSPTLLWIFAVSCTFVHQTTSLWAWSHVKGP